MISIFVCICSVVWMRPMPFESLLVNQPNSDYSSLAAQNSMLSRVAKI